MATLTERPSNFALEAKQLSVNYDKTPVLWNLDFAVPAGKLTGIIGPNGAGKSTLIRTALGLLTPVSGQLTFYGQPLNKVRQRLSYVPQRESVDWDFPITVRELVLMGRYGKLGLFRRPRRADHNAAIHYLNLVGMQEFGARQISQLSGGQQQRVFIARALMQEADIYFMDEPLAGIDHTSETVIMNLLSELRGRGKTIFVVHHDLNTIHDYFDWLVIINLRLIACGPTQEVFRRDVLQKAYGTHYALLDEALRIAKERRSGRAD